MAVISSSFSSRAGHAEVKPAFGGAMIVTFCVLSQPASISISSDFVGGRSCMILCFAVTNPRISLSQIKSLASYTHLSTSSSDTHFIDTKLQKIKLLVGHNGGFRYPS